MDIWDVIAWAFVVALAAWWLSLFPRHPAHRPVPQLRTGRYRPPRRLWSSG